MELDERLSSEAAAEIERKGFVVLRGFCSTSEVEQLRRAANAVATSDHPRSRQVLYTHAPPPEERPHLDRVLNVWLNPNKLTDTRSTASVGHAVRTRLAGLFQGRTPTLLQDLFLEKVAGQPAFPWHQDFPFWPIDAPNGVVVWIPMVPSGPDSGGVQFKVASQRIGLFSAVDLHTGNLQSGDGFPTLDGYETACPHLEAGDALVFHPLVFHMSPPLRAAAPRPAWSSVWLDPSVRWQHSRAPRHPACARTVDGTLVASTEPNDRRIH